MAASFAWPSFLIRWGTTVAISRKIRQCEWSTTYRKGLEKLDAEFMNVSVERVILSVRTKISETLCMWHR